MHGQKDTSGCKANVVSSEAVMYLDETTGVLDKKQEEILGDN